jgi:hypothetical protein
MATQAVIQVAKSGEDLETCDAQDMALSSPMLLPKIYAVVELEPDIPEGWVSGDYQYTHSRGYAPMYLYYAEHDYFQNNTGSTAFDPVRYIYNSYSTFANMDATEFVDDAGGRTNTYLVLFLDPLLEPISQPSPTSHGSPRIKVGSDLVDDADYKANIDSKYQTLKVHMQGQFVCNIPSWTSTVAMGSNWSKLEWYSFNHNLGFPPVHTPFINAQGVDLDKAYQSSIPTDFVLNDVNDLWAERWAYDFGFTGKYLEYAWIYVDINKYYVGYRRQNWDFSDGHTFPARTVRVNYTIFNLPINEEFNLLS